MAEYIKKALVAREIRKLLRVRESAVDIFQAGFEYGVNRAWLKIDKIPAADVAPVVHGHWTTECYNIPICSICGTYVSKDVYNSEDFTPKFCPNCGAKMDEEMKRDG